MNQATRGPNALLRRQRELRGWSHERVAEELHTRFPGVAVTGKEVARWERGKRIPGPYYREKLCALYSVTAEALGFAVTPLPAPTSPLDSSQDALSYVPSKGGVLVPPSVVEHMVSAYLPTLVQLAQQPSRYQKTAARLATQGYRLKGIVALHQNNLQARESYCQRALGYSEIAEDPSLLVSALISLASTFYYWSDPTKASHIYQKALLYMEHIPPLQRSRLSVELAVVYAQRGQEQEALRYLKLAQQVYPEHPENDPSFLYAEFSPASLFLEEGLTFLALTEHYPDREYDQKAWDTFAQVEEQQSKSLVPARILFEITNQQAETALALRDQELFRTYLEKGIQGAHALNSKQRRREAVKAYKQAQIIWPHELRIKELAELFL